jgi:hypothetical protein
MNVEELLRERGDQWHTPHVDEPDLGAAIGRSARRNRIARAAVAMAAVLAVGGTVWAVLPSRRDAPSIPAVPAPAATPPVPAATTTGATTTTAMPTDQALIDVARTLRSDFRADAEALPKTMEMVRSTVAEVAAASLLIAPAGTDPATPVWVMQLRGTFRCDWCSHPKGRTATQPVLLAMMRADLDVIAAGTFEQAADLGTLGRVSTVTLTPKPIGTDEEILRKGARRILAGLESVKLTDGTMAYQTTAWRAQNRLGAAASPRSYRTVWLVYLKGTFTCSACIRDQRSTHGNFLAMVVDARSGALDQPMILSAQPIDDSGLQGTSALGWVPSVLQP